eukprot:gene17805-24183_t
MWFFAGSTLASGDSMPHTLPPPSSQGSPGPLEGTGGLPDPVFKAVEVKEVVDRLAAIRYLASTPGKYVARTQLLLSPAICIDIDAACIYYIDDISASNPDGTTVKGADGKVLIMTDGAGLIHPDLCKNIPAVSSGVLRDTQGSSRGPSVCQVRVYDTRGEMPIVSKGTLTPCSYLPPNAIFMPFSMVKAPHLAVLMTWLMPTTLPPKGETLYTVKPNLFTQARSSPPAQSPTTDRPLQQHESLTSAPPHQQHQPQHQISPQYPRHSNGFLPQQQPQHLHQPTAPLGCQVASRSNGCAYPSGPSIQAHLSPNAQHGLQINHYYGDHRAHHGENHRNYHGDHPGAHHKDLYNGDTHRDHHRDNPGDHRDNHRDHKDHHWDNHDTHHSRDSTPTAVRVAHVEVLTSVFHSRDAVLNVNIMLLLEVGKVPDDLFKSLHQSSLQHLKKMHLPVPDCYRLIGVPDFSGSIPAGFVVVGGGHLQDEDRTDLMRPPEKFHNFYGHGTLPSAIFFSTKGPECMATQTPKIHSQLPRPPRPPDNSQDPQITPKTPKTPS